MLITKIIIIIIKHNILTLNQFDFDKGKNIQSIIMSLLDIIDESINEKKYCIDIFDNLSKALDVINHELLLNKLHMFDIRGVP